MVNIARICTSVLLSVLMALSTVACKKETKVPPQSIMPSSSVPSISSLMPPSAPESSVPEGSAPESSQPESGAPESKPPESSQPSNTQLKDGVYDGQAQGYNGSVKVKLTVTDGKIANVEVTENTETKDVAGKALSDIPKKIVEKNDAKVDIVSGATLTSNAIIKATQDALGKAQSQESSS